MNFPLFLTVFTSVFLAEMGDKTQLAAMMFSAKTPNAWVTVFIGSALALVCTSFLGVICGKLIGDHLNPQWVSRAAGALFVIIGVWTIWKA